MNNRSKSIKVDWPILNGSVTTAESTCGKPNCACKAKPPQLHGTYYRWTGLLHGKRTTKTLSKEMAKECEKRIKNYRQAKEQLESLLKNAMTEAPWDDET
jgi:hypothetical protein